MYCILSQLKRYYDKKYMLAFFRDTIQHKKRSSLTQKELLFKTIDNQQYPKSLNYQPLIVKGGFLSH